MDYPPCWDVVAISGHNPSDATLFCEHLQAHVRDFPNWARTLGVSLSTSIVAVPDPFTEDGGRPDAAVGSGGATLNAVLHVAEHISAQKGSGTILIDVFRGSRVAVLLCGNASGGPTGSFFGKALAPLPLGPDAALVTGGCCNLELMLLNLCRLSDSRPALWVASTEWLMHVPPATPSPFAGEEEGISALALPCAAADAAHHGVYKVGADGELLDVLYQPGAEGARAAGAVDAEGRVAVVAPIVRFCASAAEALLSLHARPPLDACTYYGYDSNSVPARLNLYLDCILAASKEGRSRYLQLAPGAAGSPVSALTQHGREVVLHAFDGVRSRACVASSPLFHAYPRTSAEWLSSLRDVASAASSDPALTPRTSSNCIDKGSEIGERTVVQRCRVDAGAVIGDDCVLICCIVKPNCRVGAGSRVYGLVLPEGATLAAGSHLGRTSTMEELAESAGFAAGAQMLEGDGIPERSARRKYSWPSLADDKAAEAAAAHLERAHEEHQFRIGLCCKIDFWNVERSLLSSEGAADVFLTPCFQRLACGTESCGPTLGWLDRLLLQMPLAQLARGLHAIADCLAQGAKGRGGLRSGPARNPHWMPALQMLQRWDGSDETRQQWVSAMANERRRWEDTPERYIRAARHYEGAAATMTARCVESAAEFISFKQLPARTDIGAWIEAAAPARIDLAGGWTDTPPVSYETGGDVINAGILVNGDKSLKAYARRLQEPILRLWTHEGECVCKDLESLSNYAVPQAQAALLKAALVALNVIDLNGPPLEEQLNALGGGLELRTMSALPVGSGLGGSSILGGVLLRALGLCVGRDYSHDALVHAVLRLEQLLTTGGGWQDQVGGFFPGFKQCKSNPGLPLKVTTEVLQPPPGTVQKLNQHLQLIYTGRARLARNLLQGVLRRWACRLPEVVDTVRGLKSNADTLRAAVLAGDVPTIGQCVGTYWTQKKEMAGGGVEPSAVRDATAAWAEHVHGSTLGGAGGGGFLFLVTREPAARKFFEESAGSVPGGQDFTFYDVQIDETGLTHRFVDSPCEHTVLGGL